jgi:hypothetical protein
MLKLDQQNDILATELSVKEQELINVQEETRELDDMITEEEETYKRVAAENKKKLEELQTKQTELNTENEVLA